MSPHKGQLYMKKDCNGCKALQECKCVLGYRILLERPEPISSPSYSFFVPMEQCPKPRTCEKLRTEQALQDLKKIRAFGQKL